MDINFNGKRALVTGAGQGIGKDIAIRLKKCGAKVLAMDINEDTLKQLKTEHPDIETVSIDLSDWNATKVAVENSGDIDLLVNNAGINILQSLGDLTEEAIDKIFAINVKAPINITQVVAENMKKRGKGGAIVNLSSISGIVALPQRTAYCASKGAIIMLTKSTAFELGKYKIRANAVAPAVVDTELSRRVFNDAQREEMKAKVPLQELAQTYHVADTVLFLLSDQAEMINGSVVPIDGGTLSCI